MFRWSIGSKSVEKLNHHYVYSELPAGAEGGAHPSGEKTTTSCFSSWGHKGFESEKVRKKRTFKSPQKSSWQKKGLFKVLKKVNVLKQASDSRKVTQKSPQKSKLAQKSPQKISQKSTFTQKSTLKSKITQKINSKILLKKEIN